MACADVVPVLAVDEVGNFAAAVIALPSGVFFFASPLGSGFLGAVLACACAFNLWREN